MSPFFHITSDSDINHMHQQQQRNEIYRNNCFYPFPKVNCNSCTRYRHYATEDIPAIFAIPDTLFFQPAFPFSDYCLKRGKAQSAKDRPAKS